MDVSFLSERDPGSFVRKEAEKHACIYYNLLTCNVM